MYSGSYGSSSRVGSGKRGHGGRSYRPPKDRGDRTAAPPPLKECNCLVELGLPEYSGPEPAGRQHLSFKNGRRGVSECEKYVRSVFQVHLQIPGRQTAGQPVAVVGQTYKNVLPAVEWILNECLDEQHVGTSNSSEAGSTIPGRIHRNVKNERERPIDGRFFLSDHAAFIQRQNQQRDHQNEEESSSEVNKCVLVSSLLFRSSSDAAIPWSVLSCRVILIKQSLEPSNGTPGASPSNDVTSASSTDGDILSKAASVLSARLDDVNFRLGNTILASLEFFHFASNRPEHSYLVAFAVGDPEKITQVADAMDHSQRGHST